MKNIIAILSLLSFNSFANISELTPNDLGVSQYREKICSSSVIFHDNPTFKQQNLKLNESVSIDVSQGLSQYVVKGKTIASNVICQKLNGQNYTGSDEEWANYVANALDSLKKAKAKNIRLILAAGKDKLYHSELSHKEYSVEADLGGNKQIIYTLAILDKLNNTVYSLSVSGNTKIKSIVKMEFTRLMDSFKLDNVG